MTCRYCQHRFPTAPRTGLFHVFAVGMIILAVAMAIWGPVWLALMALLGAAVAWMAIATAPGEPHDTPVHHLPARCPHCGRRFELRGPHAS